MAEPNWVPASSHLPQDNQLVLVNGRYITAPRMVTFRHRPTPRWEDAGTIYEFEHFDRWAPTPPVPRIDEAADMPTRADFDKLSLVIAGAIALCEVAQENFVRVNDELQRTIAELGWPSVFLLLEEEHARRRLFDARIRLSKRLAERREAQKNIARSQPEPDPLPSNVRQLRR